MSRLILGLKLKRMKAFLPISVLGLSSFGLGYLTSDLEDSEVAPVCLVDTYQETSIVQLQGLEGDLLQTSISGPVRLVWGDAFVEGEGEHQIPLGQFLTEADRQFENFKYVGNAKTLKFYPADSYPARGTHPSVRRFFASREQAEAAGFVASKLVK